ncbi:hypothetical protein CDD81_3292 [Ophiocordyceps australis]|uniref:Uncharacterized protein n=1 Tax=Ophiocordyceps australis TaxID=1399860 RepID=A0A2C5YE60_9HYPO|nr:hypothetical protein CDD81_3292 [Ophiocordyceps australis]
MDAAAKTIEWLSQQILPEKPHHLSYNPQWRYRPRPDDSTSRFEEWHNTRLQYMTLVSQADRGTLMTRPYYDMREEPPKPVPRQVSALAKPGDKKKKLSLSDYKNKKTGLASSNSPPEPSLLKQREADRAASPPHPPSHSSNQLPPSSHPPQPPPQPPPPASAATDARKPTPDLKRPENARLHDSRPSSVEAKPRQPREGPSDTKLPPKPPSLPPKPPSPPAKRRAAEADDARPLKRPRPEEKRATDSSLHRDDVSRRKDRVQNVARDAPPSTEDGSANVPNGRSTLKNALNSTKNASPVAPIRRESVNGVRSNSKENTRSEKVDASKPSLPPLLSPLHFSFGNNDRSQHGHGQTSPKMDKKRKADTGNASPHNKKTEAEAGRKKGALAMTIPPILSPTLPPAIEDEIRRRKKASSEVVAEKTKENGRKKPVVDNDEAPAPPPPRLGHRRRLIVSLFIPETLRPAFRKMIAPLGRRETVGPEADRERKKERPASDETPQAAQARKRPAGAIEGAGETTASKRPRTSDLSSLSRVAATPSTPSKKSTAMSRVSSSNSLAQTPGEHVTSTPAALAAPDRRANGQDSGAATKGEKADVQSLTELEERLTAKAKSLKRNGDSMLRDFRNSHINNAKGKPVEHKVKLGYVLSMESIIAFFMAFQTDDKIRSAGNKLWDHWKWQSLFPLIEHMLQEVSREGLHNSQPLYALLLILHARCHDELLKCYGQYDQKSLKQNDIAPIDQVLSRVRRRARLWTVAHDAVASIDNADLRADMTPWASLDDVTEASLKVLRRWCAEERVDWTPQPMIRDSWPISKAGQS